MRGRRVEVRGDGRREKGKCMCKAHATPRRKEGDKGQEGRQGERGLPPVHPSSTFQSFFVQLHLSSAPFIIGW